jgi:hypothetical protein
LCGSGLGRNGERSPLLMQARPRSIP